MREQENTGVLLDERRALNEYLDSLLQEIPAAPEPSIVSPERRSESPVPVRETVRETQDGVPVQSASAPEEPVRPEWAKGPFQCLTFKVAGLTLAVPLVRLNGVIDVPGEITPMPGHQPWFLGLIRHLEQQVKVVDIGRIVLPQGHEYSPVEPGHVILIDDSRWGIACEGETQMITLPEQGVRWRTSRSKRPWLAGTVIEHMCAILDVDALASELATGEWSAAGATGVKKSG